jgi:hypothetical protein
MTRISSGSARFMTRVFPVLWFGFLVFFVGTAFTNAIIEGFEAAHLVFVAVPILMAVIGYAVTRQVIWGLVDEVFDHGDYLVVRHRGQEARIDLADVVNVNFTPMNPPRITLRLRQPGPFGPEVSFSPVHPFTLNPFAKNQVAESLIVRVDRARSKRAF